MSEQPPWDSNAKPMTAFIREDECIGCTKCIPDCPTDAIMGAPKLMHTVITDVCTGCELCVPTCPVDCIDIIPLEPRTSEQAAELHQQWLARFEKHNKRIARNKHEQQTKHDKARLSDVIDSVAARKQYIDDVLKRAKKK